MVSIIIPIYNEKEIITKMVNNICKHMDNSTFAYELILVDDGSTDGSKEIICQLTSSFVKKVVHSQNRGYGAALKSGIRVAKNNILVISDADGTYPNEKIPEFIKILMEEDFDMVVGARVGRHVKIPLIRKPGKWFITKLANYLSGSRIPDLNSGLRVFKKELVEKFIKILPDGYSFTSTITLALLTNGYSIKYVPIDYYKREGKSKLKPVQDTLNFIQLIIRTVLYFAPLKVFVPLSLSLVLLSFFVLFGSWLFLGKIMDVTFGVILMTAVVVLAVGMLADLIDKRIE